VNAPAESLVPQSLPTDLAAAHAMILAERQARIEAQSEALAAKAAASSTEVTIAHLKLMIEKLKRELYGRRSECTARLIDQMEFQLAELEEAATEDEIATEATARQASLPAPALRRRPVRKPFPEHLPRERVVIAVPTSCPCCGSMKLSKLGEDVTETLEVVPRSWKVIQTVRERFSCRQCEAITQPPAPFHVTPRGFVGPNLLAMVLFEKFGQHQPLNRQSERYGREGIDLSVSTLADQVGAATAALAPLHELIARHVMTAERLHADDTTVLSWPRARPTRAGSGPMCATTGPSAAPIRRRCSTSPRATGGTSIRTRISRLGAVSCRPTPMADTMAYTIPRVRAGRSRRRSVGPMPAAASLSSPTLPRAHGAGPAPRPCRRSPWRR